jgi:hypothetical protein
MILLLLIHLAEKTAAKNLQIAGVASPAAKLGTPRQSSGSSGFQTVLGCDDTSTLLYIYSLLLIADLF